MSKTTKEVAIRFLKSGYIKTTIPASAAMNEAIEFCKEFLDSLSDQELIEGMRDCIGQESMFDADSFQVDAIEIDDAGTLIYSSKQRNAFTGFNRFTIAAEKSKEGLCYKCDSSKVDFGIPDSIGGGQIVRKCRCKDCNHKWQEVFELQAVEDIER